ncbi:MAG: adenosine deaminase [Lachnospiraceae bacterium]
MQPKLDLHCHLDGSLTLQTVRELLGREVSLEELQVQEPCENLETYLEKFELPIRCLQTEKGLEVASFRFLEEVAKEQICYIEVRFAPLLSVNEKLSCQKVIESVLRGLERGKQAYGVGYNVIVCTMRHHTYAQNLEMMKVAREFLGQGVVAVDLAGNEAAFPMTEFKELFAKAKEWEFPFTIHAGECGSVDNVIEAISYGAKRIGHGIALKGHTQVQQWCKEKQIGIELCPTSNMQTKAVSSPKEYPILEFLENELCVTINTDNRMVSNTTMDKEIAFVKRNYGIGDEAIQQMMRTAVEISFASEEEKDDLRTLID